MSRITTSKSSILAFAFAAASFIASTTQAVVYNVNRSVTNGALTANLIGTVTIPTGNYVIQNEGASPFTNVNLSLTVNSTSYNLVNALTGVIIGTGHFIINATPTTLTFSTANADGFNPADLVFSDTTVPASNNRYVIGSNGLPAFEAAYTNAGTVFANATLP